MRDSPCSKLLAPAFIFASENRFPVNIETLETSEVLILNKDAFLEFMHQYPIIMQNFLKLISDRSLFLSKKLNEFALTKPGNPDYSIM